jgi:hypothetical protein
MFAVVVGTTNSTANSFAPGGMAARTSRKISNTFDSSQSGMMCFIT